MIERTVKFFEDGTEVFHRYTGSHFSYIRGRIKGEIKQFGNGKVTKFTISASNGKKKDSDEWYPSTFCDCTAFGEVGQKIFERYSEKDEIEAIAKFYSKKGDDGKYYSGFNIVDVPRMKPESEAEAPTNSTAQDFSDDDLPF